MKRLWRKPLLLPCSDVVEFKNISAAGQSPEVKYLECDSADEFAFGLFVSRLSQRLEEFGIIPNYVPCIAGPWDGLQPYSKNIPQLDLNPTAIVFIADCGAMSGTWYR